MNNESAIAHRTTITELVRIWKQSSEEIVTGFAMVQAAQKRLDAFFDSSSVDMSVGGRDLRFDDADGALAKLQRGVWRALIARMNLRQILSLKRTAELDRQLETGEGLPPLTQDAVETMVSALLDQSGDLLAEKVREVYDWVRPGGYALKEYKTNQKSELVGLGSKIIKPYTVERCYSGAGFRINYHRTDEVRALDQVFHLLDGKTTDCKTWQGELGDAITQQTKNGSNEFETDYFKGRCFKNGNLHLEFKRADLVEQFNLIAGGKRLQRPL